MPSAVDLLKSNISYLYVAIGLAWLVPVYLVESFYILWPVVVFVIGGVMLKLWPSRRLTWAWALAAALMGATLSGYQAYFAALESSGVFSSLAGVSLVGFGAFAILQLAALYLAGTRK